MSFTIPQGAFVAIVGPSGSGKTTLLGLLAGLDTPTRGQRAARRRRPHRDDRGRTRAAARRRKLDSSSRAFNSSRRSRARERAGAARAARRVGRIASRHANCCSVSASAIGSTTCPSQLSGGEQQRVAIARAFANRPRILFADEPTGNLDGDTGARIVELLEELNRESQTTIVLVTHDLTLARRAQRLIRLADGLVVEDTGTGDGRRAIGRERGPRRRRSERAMNTVESPSHESRVTSHAFVRSARVARIAEHASQAAALHVVDLARRRGARGDRLVRRQHHAFGSRAVARPDRRRHRLLGTERLDAGDRLGARRVCRARRDDHEADDLCVDGLCAAHRTQPVSRRCAPSARRIRCTARSPRARRGSGNGCTRDGTCCSIRRS